MVAPVVEAMRYKRLELETCQQKKSPGCIPKPEVVTPDPPTYTGIVLELDA